MLCACVCEYDIMQTTTYTAKVGDGGGGDIGIWKERACILELSHELLRKGVLQ